MTVKELITRLLDFDQNRQIVVEFEPKKDADILEVFDWHGRPIIRFERWEE